MATVESEMLALGTRMPEFRLPDPDGVLHSLPATANAFLVMFICNHCPFVVHVRDELARLGRDYGDRGVAIVAINSNDAEKYPDDSPEKMKLEARNTGYTFPYLVDAEQTVAQQFRAACTPDFFLFDSDRRLVYRGQLDDSRPRNNEPVDGQNLRAALDSLLSEKPVAEVQKPSIGCSIKWKPGNEPAYF